MNLTELLHRLFPPLAGRAIARRLARESCRALLPAEPILGAVVCADEPERYVVRVFCGNRPPSAENFRLPPWQQCLIFAVKKDSYAVQQITDERYYPQIR